jgi:hypothetical protein
MRFYEWKIEEGKTPSVGAGIYILLLNNPIPKLYKKDEKKILYIGRAKYLSQRLRVRKHKDWEEDYEKPKDSLMFDHSALTFSVDIENKTTLRPHKASIDDGILKEKDTLYLRYALTKKYVEIEKQLLFGHIMLYGQLPPFNNKGPTLKYIWNEMSNHRWKQAIANYEKVIGDIQI